MGGRWKEPGKGLGFAFRDLGKAIIKSGATAVKKADDWANKEDCPENPEETVNVQNSLEDKADKINVRSMIMKKIISAIMVLCMLVCLSACGECEHEWTYATCKEPKICTLCGETEGTVAEHKWKEATCHFPKTCTVCKITDGEKVAEHNWIPADCENPERCTICGDIKGMALGHKWKDATYDAPQTCEVCFSTIGSPMERPAFSARIKNSIPLTINNYYSSGKLWNSVKITDVRVEYEKTYSGDNEIVLYFSGEKLYDSDGPKQSDSCSVGIKVYDKDGYVVADETYYTHDIKVGDKFRNDKCSIWEDLPDGEYIIELLSTN